MLRFPRSIVALAALGGIGLAGGVARAGGTESVCGPQASNCPRIPNPSRYLLINGQYVDVSANPRPQNLNPTGINFSDCEQDLKLTFPLVLSGFDGGSGVEVWAGTTDCTSEAARGIGANATCWRLGPPANVVSAMTSYSTSVDVYARDVLRYAGGIPPAQSSYDPSFHSGPQGESACHAQPTDAAITVNVWVVPVDISTNRGMETGTPYEFPLSTDTVAPAPPPNVTVGTEDTALDVMWQSPTPADPDVAGFSVWIDPPAGGASSSGGGGGCGCGSTPGASPSPSGDGSAEDAGGSQLVCEDAGLDASTDAQADGGVPAGCHTVNSAGGNEVCESSALTGSSNVVGGGGTSPSADAGTAADAGSDAAPADAGLDAAASPDAAVSSDAGPDAAGGGGGVVTGGGGISQIRSEYKAGEKDDPNATSMTISGLINFQKYAVVVTTLDGSGNVGPASAPQCAEPQPVSDFWSKYKESGGGAGGCALEGRGAASSAPVLAGIVALAAALLRRRRRRG